MRKLTDYELNNSTDRNYYVTIKLNGTRIETGKMTPDTKLTKKLEKALNITLLEKIDNVDLNQFINSSSGERTLGNIMKIKRK